MKNIINKIFIVLVSILLLISSILVTSKNHFYKYIQIAGFGLVTIYLIIRMIQRNPVKLVKNKLDICVFTLVISTIIPVITNKYVSLYGSFQVLMQYVYALTVYILLREITQNTTGFGKIITNIFIISSVILIFIGIDGITLNTLSDFLKNIKIGFSENGDNRLISTVGYANALAVYIASMLFLNINEYINYKNVAVKSIYKTITTILMIGIILTYSKGVMLVSILTLILYIIAIRNKKLRIEVVQNLIVSLIISIMFIYAFENLFYLSKFVVIWIILGMIIIVNYIINILIEKINENIEEIDIKKILIVGIVGLICFSIYVVIGLRIYDEYVVFDEDTWVEYAAKAIDGIKRKYQI